MYVCICNNVTDKDIAKAVENGCHSLDTLQQHTQLGTQCGSCINEACAILKQLKTKGSLPVHAPLEAAACYDHA